MRAECAGHLPPPPHTTPAPTLLVAVDQRSVLSLNGDWHYIVDPYDNGLGGGRSGYPMDEEVPAGSNKLLEYSFAKSPTIKVPGDWNTQKESLLYYEGGFWYERHFQYQPQPGHRAFLHIGAANYRSRVWVNGQLLCTHEGGFTQFDCEATQAVKAGENSVVIFVDSTRIADGVPTLKTDWWNYGGLTRDVSLVTVPQRFIDDFELHLDRATRSSIEGYVHVEGAQPGTQGVGRSTRGEAARRGRDRCRRTSRGQPLRARTDAVVAGEPEAIPRRAEVGEDTLTDEMGFRTIETSGSEILLTASRLCCTASASTPKLPIAPVAPITTRTWPLCWAG